MEQTPGKRILIWREYKGLTPAQMIKATGIKRSTLDSVEDPNGSKPSHDTLMKVAAAFPDLNARWLLTGEGEMTNGQRLMPLAAKPADSTPEPTPGLTTGAATVAEAENILLRELVDDLKADKARLLDENGELREENKKLLGKSSDSSDAADDSATPATPRPKGPRAGRTRSEAQPIVRVQRTGFRPSFMEEAE